MLAVSPKCPPSLVGSKRPRTPEDVFHGCVESMNPLLRRRRLTLTNLNLGNTDLNLSRGDDNAAPLGPLDVNASSNNINWAPSVLSISNSAWSIKQGRSEQIHIFQPVPENQQLQAGLSHHLQRVPKLPKRILQLRNDLRFLPERDEARIATNALRPKPSTRSQLASSKANFFHSHYHLQ